MPKPIRPIAHDDRLSLVDHLDELRARLIVSAAVLVVALGLCLWQNHELLHIINKPLQEQTRKQVERGEGTVGQAVLAQRAVVKVAGDASAALSLLSNSKSGLSPGTRAGLQSLTAALQADVAKVPRQAVGDKPAVLGVGETFTTTLTVALYFALIISLPVILYELYGFILPALSPQERRVARPLLTAVPFLFVTGVAFGYFVALPAATRFFVNFNSSEFNIIVQASQYYKFAATILLALGVVFQVPVVILGAARLGLVTPRQLRGNRRYALLACAAVAAFLPGDAITLALETVPLYVLYEVSILLAVLVDRAESRRRGSASAAAVVVSTEGGGAPPGAPAPSPDDNTERGVQEIIDHIDRGLSD
jgi:sec-independent protein translocase protein TatC